VPRAVPSDRRERAAHTATAAPVAEQDRRPASPLRAYGERPAGLFGGVPVSEIAILAGGVAVIVGWLQGGSVALFAGLAICFLAVLELTAREHFSGYRSHATLLAGMAAVAVETGIGLLVAPRERLALVVVMVPVFAVTFTLLRRRFTVARQARVRALPEV
jgi:hypothetical protein